MNFFITTLLLYYFFDKIRVNAFGGGGGGNEYYGGFQIKLIKTYFIPSNSSQIWRDYNELKRERITNKSLNERMNKTFFKNHFISILPKQ
jgi:hypothetical protein